MTGTAIDSHARAVDFLLSLVRADPTPDAERERVGLAPVRELLRRLGDPHRGLAFVHVAGSKGKGSTVLLAERLAHAAGLRTASFTSPHLRDWTERFRLDGRPIDRPAFVALMERVRPHVEAMSTDPGIPAPSFFDVLTGAALALFRDAGVELAVLETGLGGRLDATNVVTPRVCCITTIELEHTDRLGTTLAAIAGEKAGIIKPGVPLVLGRVTGEAREVIVRRARELGAPVTGLGEALAIRRLPGAAGHRVTLATGNGQLEVIAGHRSPVMADNAALALACTALGGVIATPALARAAPGVLGDGRIEGRLDVLGRAPLRVVDAAHTARSARELADLLAALGRDDWRLVLSTTAGKPLQEILAPLLERAATVIATCAEPSRSLPAGELARGVRALRPDLEVVVRDDPRAALELALALATPAGAVCAAGSVYLAGIAIDLLAR